MTRVKLAYGKFSVWVYAEADQPHKLPHCHVKWSDGDAAVSLPSLLEIAGAELPKPAKKLLADHLEEICQAWDLLNPTRNTE